MGGDLDSSVERIARPYPLSAADGVALRGADTGEEAIDVGTQSRRLVAEVLG